MVSLFKFAKYQSTKKQQNTNCEIKFKLDKAKLNKTKANLNK